MTALTQEQITAGNKLIAEWMNLVVIPAGTRTIGSINLPEISEAFLRYHKSLDRLNEAWAKFVFEAQSLTTQGDDVWLFQIRQNYYYAIDTNDIAAAFMVVIDAIQLIKKRKP